MKWRIERAGAPGAYLPGWLVLDPSGHGVIVPQFAGAVALVVAGIEFAHCEATA